MSCRPSAATAPLTAALAAVLIAAPAPQAAAATQLQVKGSDTIGGALGPDLARAYEKSNPAVEVHWESLGSGTAFVGLFDGSADLGASSRSIKESEIEQAASLGIQLKEYVLGYDGIAVLVHPSNGVSDLTIDQISAIFSGAIDDWSVVGGPNRPIHRVSRPSYSGTHGFFKEHVLRKGRKDGKEEFAADTEFIEHSADIVERVAADPDAITYLGMGWVSPAVKPVRVRPAPGEPGVLPSPETVRAGSYPVYRPLLLYTRGEPTGELRRFLSFILAGDGQALVAENDFIPSDAPCTVCRTVSPDATGANGAADDLELHRVWFRFGATTLDASAKSELARVAERLAGGDVRVLVVGHADSEGDAVQNRNVSLARALTVAGHLRRLGVLTSLIEVEAAGSDQPIATNESADGRSRNRRVDVRLLPLDAAAR